MESDGALLESKVSVVFGPWSLQLHVCAFVCHVNSRFLYFMWVPLKQ